MVAFCQRHGISLLCYGTVAGGFLSDRYLGAPEPEPPLDNRSLVKYQLIIQDFGGWKPFQSLLATLRSVADKHGTTLATIAMRYVLGRSQVGAVIVGARHARHLPDLLRLFDFELDEEDLAAIQRAVDAGVGPVGDVYAAERIKGGKHAAIMKYNLNKD